MDAWWKGLTGVVNVAFVPVFLVMRGGVNGMRQLTEAERKRRIADYKRSPDSHLLRLT